MGAMYGFSPMTQDDLPMVGRWLAEPEVAVWWGDPAEQLALVTEDLAEPRMRQWIVDCDGRPFAYAQDYNPEGWDHVYPDLRPGERAVDPFIGPPDMLGRGHGAGFMRALARRLIDEGAPSVLIDPEPANVRAIRAYEKAGFRAYGQVDHPVWGPALLMRCTPQTLTG